MGQNKKIYRTGNGLVVSTGFRFSSDRGALYENLVAVALKKEEIAGRICRQKLRHPVLLEEPTERGSGFCSESGSSYYAVDSGLFGYFQPKDSEAGAGAFGDKSGR